MHKKFTYRILAIFLFVFISVSFLVPSDLNAETRKFWVKDGYYEDQDFWVTSGYFKDTQEKRWVDTSYMVESGYWETNKTWVDTSHMVYQGYWKNSTYNVWVDTSYWKSEGHYEYVTERVWVKSGYWAYRNVNKWIDTSHYETRSSRVWVKSGYTASRWVDTSHWVRQSYQVYVRSGYTVSRWVDTSHWETRYRDVRQSYRVYVSSGYWQYYWKHYWYGWRLLRRWINTSHWETRYRTVRQSYRVYVRSGYTTSRWVDTSHYETRYRNVWVTSGHTSYYWVDTSHWKTIYYMVWVSSGYWTTVREAYYIDTSHYENQKVWVAGHNETRYREVEDWQPCDKVIEVSTEYDKWWKLEWLWGTTERYKGKFKGKIYGTMYKYKKFYIYYGQFGFWDDLDVNYPDDPLTNYEIARPFKIRYECYEVLNGYKKEAYSEWVPGDWKKEWVDTSHLVNSGYWQSDTYSSWVDTSYMKSEGHWETKKEWVDTSHLVESGYWEDYTKRTWVDTSHSETRDVWVDTSHWVEADLDPEGKVLHTEQWNINRINYNTLKTGDPDDPRGYEIFFNGERFVLECDTPGDFQPESIHVEFLGTKFETDLTYTGDIKWEGYIWDESFIYFHDRNCVFKFTASYNYNGDQFDIEDEVTVYIVRDYYWRLHRGF